MNGIWAISAVLVTFRIIEVCRFLTTARLPLDKDTVSVPPKERSQLCQ